MTMTHEIEAFLQHGETGGPYATESVEVKETDQPMFYSASGYGSRIPTRYMIRQPGGRWRRVYAICWSNVASFYVGGRDRQPRTIVTIY